MKWCNLFFAHMRSATEQAKAARGVSRPRRDYTRWVMSVASLQNIEKSFGRRVLFDRLNLNIERGERIGFIGANGSGKTTLFKLIAGEVTAEAGTVAIADGV